MSTPTQFRHYLISQDAAGANIELIRSGEQVCVLAFDARRLCFVHCHVLLEPLGRNRAAFEERARMLSETGHPLAARVLDFGEDDGSPFYITENVDGETLRSLIVRHDTIPVWLAQRLTTLSLAAQRAVVERGDFVTLQPLDALRVLQIGARELRVCAADYRVVEPPGTRTVRGRQAKSAFEKQAQFIATFFAEQTAAKKGKSSSAEIPMVNTTDFLEILHNLLLACAPEMGDAIDQWRRKLEETTPQPPEADLAAPYKPRSLLGPLLASYQEVARCVVQTVRVQSQKLDPAQPYALRGTLMRTGQNVFVEQVAPLLLAGVIPGEVLRQARSQPKGGKHPNLVPVIFVEENDGLECFAETAVEGVTLAEVLATRGKLDAQEIYLVLAGVDAALAQLEKAGRVVRRLRLEDIFLFTGFGQGRAQDASLLRTKLNEWPGFSIVLRAHPCLHSMSGRGADPAMLLPVEPQAKGGTEPLWNGGWLAALSTFLSGNELKQGSSEDAVTRMFEDELGNARRGGPSPRSSFLARFARVLREHDLAQLKDGGFWPEVSGSSAAPQSQAAEVTREVAPQARTTSLPPSRSRPFAAVAAAPVPEIDEGSIGFAEALIRGAHGPRDGLAISVPAGRDDDEEVWESSWSGFRQRKPIWLRVALWSLAAIVLGAVLAHMQSRALWQRGPAQPPEVVVPQNPNALPTAPPATTPKTPLLPPPPAVPVFPAKPPKQEKPAAAAVPDALTTRLKQMRLAREKLPADLRPSVEKAAQAGNTEAMLALGDAILAGGEPGTNGERAAFGWFKKAMEAGDPNARLPLAQCYLEGWGTAPDHPRAVELLITASKAGEAAAKDLLGVCYARALGVPKDDNRAFQLCSDAYSAGVASACGNLGGMYLRGQGVSADAVRAVKLFAEGSKKHDSDSMLQYARCLESGTGVALDAAQASSWYQQAARAGNAEAAAWCQQHRVVY